MTSGAWTALMAPRDTAQSKLGAQPRGGAPQDLTDHIRRETEKWKPIVAALNLKVD